MTRCEIRGTFDRHGPEKIIAQSIFMQSTSLFLQKVGIRMNFQKNIALDTLFKHLSTQIL